MICNWTSQRYLICFLSLVFLIDITMSHIFFFFGFINLSLVVNIELDTDALNFVKPPSLWSYFRLTVIHQSFHFFDQFLEEARNHASNILSLPQSDSLEKVRMKDTKKKKKTWQRSVSFWFKFGRSAGEEATSKTNTLKDSSNPLDADHRPMSGRLFGNGSKFSQLHRRIRQSTSGPLACCFTPTRAEETEVPYRYLDHQNHPLRAQAFGPIYLVT